MVPGNSVEQWLKVGDVQNGRTFWLDIYWEEIRLTAFNLQIGQELTR
jgi:hypothetical protein